MLFVVIASRSRLSSASREVRYATLDPNIFR